MLGYLGIRHQGLFDYEVRHLMRKSLLIGKITPSQSALTGSPELVMQRLAETDELELILAREYRASNLT